MYCLSEINNLQNTGEQIIHIIRDENVAHECLNHITCHKAKKFVEDLTLPILNMTESECLADGNLVEGLYLLKVSEIPYCIKLIKKINVVNHGYVYNTFSTDKIILYTWSLIPYNFDKELSKIGYINEFREVMATEINTDIIPVLHNNCYKYYDLVISQFNIKNMCENPIIAVIGKNNQVRENIIANLVKQIIDPQNAPTVIISSGTNKDSYGKLFPNAYVESDIETIQDILFRQLELVDKHIATDSKDKYPNLCIILDDFLFSNIDTLKDEFIFNELLHNVSTYGITLIMVTNNDLSNDIKANLNYVCICPEMDDKSKKKLYKNYVGMLPNFKTFTDIFDTVTSNDNYMILNNTNDTFELSKSLYWCCVNK